MATFPELHQRISKLKTEKELLLDQVTELKAKLEQLETENMLLHLKLTHLKANCEKWIKRYRKLNKYSQKLLKQSIEDSYSFINKN